MITDLEGKPVPEFTLNFVNVTWGFRLKLAWAVLFARSVRLT